MPTIIRKTTETMIESRRDILRMVNWQVRSSVWSPPTDVYETDDAYIVRVEIAGAREENIDVTLENNTLFIRGNRHDTQGRRAYHQMEIQFGRFESVIGIPGSIDAEGAQVDYENGFLTIYLPKEVNKKEAE